MTLRRKSEKRIGKFMWTVETRKQGKAEMDLITARILL